MIFQGNAVVLDDSEGETVDYAVKMRRLPEERVMERLLGENAGGSDMLALWQEGT